MLNALILAALSVVPVYTNHNRVAGNVQTMTNIQSWAQAVEEAIGSGGLDTNAVQSIIQRNIDTNLLLSASATNGLMRASDYHGDYITDGNHRIDADMAVWGNSFSAWSYSGDNVESAILIGFEVQWVSGSENPSGVDGWCAPYGQYGFDWAPFGSNYTDPNALALSDTWETVSVPISFSISATRTRGLIKTTRLATTNDIPNAYTKAETDAAIVAATNTVGEQTIVRGEYDEYIGGWDITAQIGYYANNDMNGRPIADTYATKDEIPTSLPNPNALTFTGAASGTYDGSAAKTVNIPSTAAIESSVASISNRQDTLEGYIAGQRVRVSVTNYYGNTSGQLPRLRIEEFITATNVTDGVSTETNYWQMVWDEQDKYDQFKSEATSAIAAMTNNLYQTYYALLMERLNTKAPRAWGTLTSAGEAAPAGSVWHTEPNTVFAGGTEYAHAMVGTGVIGVLTTKGAAVYTDGETGRFHFTTDDKTSYFGMNIATRYELGCATDGITVTDVGGNKMVDLLYNVTMTGKPILYYTPTLSGNITWEQITDSSGGAISGATVYASWDAAPPAGSEICTINCGAGVSGFFKASVEYAGTCKFETNMMADLQGGVLATNQTSNQMQPVEPYISNGSVLWRIKQ